MLDFKTNVVFKLKETTPDEVRNAIQPLMVSDESIMKVFKANRDYVVFTDRRLIAVDVQGISGKKQDFTSLPYNKIQAWSVETAGVLDLDAELELWFSGLGKVRMEFKGQTDIRALGQMIGTFALR